MKNQRLTGWFIVFLVLAIWIANLWFCSGWETSERGTFGDLFGASNALFSGLAFAGVLITLFLQRQQLLDAQAANHSQTELLMQQMFESTYLQLIGFHRGIITGLRLQKDATNYQSVEVLDQIYISATRIYNANSKLNESERIHKAFADLPKDEYSELFKILKSFVYILNFISENKSSARNHYEMLLSVASTTEIVILIYILYSSNQAARVLKEAEATRFILPQFLLDESHFRIIEEWIKKSEAPTS